MDKFKVFLSILFLLTAVVIIGFMAIFDQGVFLRIADIIRNNIIASGIAALIFLIFLSAGFVSNMSKSYGSLLSNGYFLLAILELFLFSAGLVYLRYYSSQPGQIVLQLKPDTTRDFINVAVRSYDSTVIDTVMAPGDLNNRPAGKYNIETVDQDIVYYRAEVDLQPGESKKVVIPVTLNVRTLSVQSEPAGAEIWINGLQASQTPDSFNILTGDTVILELKMPAYQVYTDTIALIDHVDLGVIPLRKMYTLWISSDYTYSRYTIYDTDDRVVFSASGSRKIELAQGNYRISYEIGEGQYQSKTISLNYNASIQIP